MSNSTTLNHVSPTAKPGGNEQLRVAVVCDFLEEQWLSMDRCAEMLVGGLQKYHWGDVSATRVRPGMRKLFPRLPLVGRARHARNADRLLNRLIEYPRYVRNLADKFDVFHIVDHSYSHLVHSLPPERCVVTCHDLDTFRCILDPARDRRPLWFRSMARHILEGLQRAARIICVSSAIRNELLQHSLMPPEQVAVVPNCVHPAFSADAAPNGDRAASLLLGKEDSRATDILHVGSTVSRKRIEDLLNIFAGIRRCHPNARLIRVGGEFTDSQKHLISKLGQPKESIVILPQLDLDTLAAVYRRAAVVLQPSEREGFGLPVIEAMASGTPVLASALPVFHEVGGTAARFCPVGDIDLWQEALNDLLHERGVHPELWAVRRAQCITHARQFDWNKHAGRVSDVYRETVKEKLSLSSSGAVALGQ
jgi:glycosyltransferase involved in cell wall biosynthesis